MIKPREFNQSNKFLAVTRVNGASAQRRALNVMR